MKNLIKIFIFTIVLGILGATNGAEAVYHNQPAPYYLPQPSYIVPPEFTGTSFQNPADMDQLMRLIMEMLYGGQNFGQFGYSNSYNPYGFNDGYYDGRFRDDYGPYGYNSYDPYGYNPYDVYDDRYYDDRRYDDDRPDVETDRARDVEDNSAELRGEVDMNGFRNGIVFFVYGEDESQIDDVDRDYDSYWDVDEDGDDLQKVRVDTDLDGSRVYRRDVRGLDDDTRHYFRICVEYDDNNYSSSYRSGNERLECGRTEDFETDRD